MTRLALTHTESSQLLPVLALAICSIDDGRALLIKGATSTAHGVRQTRASADVDVLVEPDRFVSTLEAFERAGWEICGGRSLRFGPIFGVGLEHELWPQTIDLHRQFVGFGAHESDVFEALWSDRATVLLAGQGVVGAGAVSACLIQALHALRDPQEDVHDEFGQAVTWLRNAGEDVRCRVARLAQATGSAGTAAPLLEGASIVTKQSDQSPVNDRVRDFRRRSLRGENLVVGYLLELAGRPIWSWPPLFFRFVFGAPASLKVWFPNSVNTDSQRRLRGRRLRDALCLMPGAIRIMWRTR